MRRGQEPRSGVAGVGGGRAGCGGQLGVRAAGGRCRTVSTSLQLLLSLLSLLLLLLLLRKQVQSITAYSRWI